MRSGGGGGEAESLRAALITAGAIDNSRGLDYVIASHVVEHVPDLVFWLAEIRGCLQPTGRLRLAVPDKRFTFDYLRRTSSLTDVLDAYVRQRRTPSGSRVLDFTLNMTEVDCGAAWRGEIDAARLKKTYTTESALGLAHDAEENGTYHDVHCWVFTPSSFCALMSELADIGLLEFACEWLLPTARNTYEFFVGLEPADDAAVIASSWRDAARLLPDRGPR